MMLIMLTNGSRSWASVFCAVISNGCAAQMCGMLHVGQSQGPTSGRNATAIVEVSKGDVGRRAAMFNEHYIRIVDRTPYRFSSRTHGRGLLQICHNWRFKFTHPSPFSNTRTFDGDDGISAWT